MRKTVELFGVNIDAVNMEKAVALLKDFCNEDRVHPVYTANSEIIMSASKDSQFKDILNAGDMVTADGAGVILAAKILGLDLPQKVSGVDLVRTMLPVAARPEYRFSCWEESPELPGMRPGTWNKPTRGWISGDIPTGISPPTRKRAL